VSFAIGAPSLGAVDSAVTVISGAAPEREKFLTNYFWLARHFSAECLRQLVRVISFDGPEVIATGVPHQLAVWNQELPTNSPGLEGLGGDQVIQAAEADG
jgi:hypothetical protein